MGSAFNRKHRRKKAKSQNSIKKSTWVSSALKTLYNVDRCISVQWVHFCKYRKDLVLSLLLITRSLSIRLSWMLQYGFLIIPKIYWSVVIFLSPVLVFLSCPFYFWGWFHFSHMGERPSVTTVVIYLIEIPLQPPCPELWTFYVQWTCWKEVTDFFCGSFYL